MNSKLLIFPACMFLVIILLFLNQPWYVAGSITLLAFVVATPVTWYLAKLLRRIKFLEEELESKKNTRSDDQFIDAQLRRIYELEDQLRSWTGQSADPTYASFQEQLIIGKMIHELRKAETKHPDWPVDELCKQVAIISEEAGEVAKAVLQYEDESGSLSEIEEELLQTAAMCIRMLKNLRP